jgi:hypothetical protein
MLGVNEDEHVCNKSTQPHVHLNTCACYVGVEECTPDVPHGDRSAFASCDGGYGQRRSDIRNWRGIAEVLVEPLVLLVPASHEPRLELLVLAGCREYLFEKHGAADVLVTLDPGKVGDQYAMPYLLVHHLLKLGDDHRPCFIVKIA